MDIHISIVYHARVGSKLQTHTHTKENDPNNKMQLKDSKNNKTSTTTTTTTTTATTINR